MALRSYSVLYILLPTIIIIIQECSQALEISKCLWSLSCGGVPNMLLVLSTTFHFHSYIWGCRYSTGPFQLRWFRGYIHSSCYYHHQIGSINLTHYHIFPWLCACDVYYVIFCQLLHIHCGKTGILFSLLLCRLWWVQISGYVLACRLLSIIQYMGLCVFSLPIPLVMIERIYTLSYYHQIGSMNYYPLFRVRSWNNGMRCMTLSILIGPDNGWAPNGQKAIIWTHDSLVY